MKRASSIAVLLSVLSLSACAAFATRTPTLSEVITGPQRTPEFAARDRYRHPQQTLEFFGVKPEMTVVEVWPASGWYTEILAPYLREHGRYYATGYAVSQDATPEWRHEDQLAFIKKIRARPYLYDRVAVTELGPDNAWVACPPGSADRVLTFRNVHNWMKGGYEAHMFRAFYDALKPGGVLGVVEHRAKRGTTLAQMKKSGYITEAHVIRLAQNAGLKLLARTEINANSKDSTHHPEGVWTLPPTLKLGDAGREKYLAIGESDRMTLMFVEPVFASPLT